MSSIGTGYDLSAATYSPDGRVFQVEYAAKAVENSGTAIGMTCKDGVVFGVEKIVSSALYEAKANPRNFTIGRHIGLAFSGLSADARQIVNRARQEASSYRTSYGGNIPLKMLAERVAGFMQAYTLYSHVRPFGASVILGTYTNGRPEIFMIEPSGVYWGYRGVAVGKGRQSSKTELEKLKLGELTCREAIKAIAKIIHTIHDDVKDKEFVLEMSWVCDESDGKHVLVPDELVQEAETQAKKELEDDDSDDDMDE